ncbi:hypothetical protein U0070_022665 [Myodes glareolus]|uniref:Uncharacterized protein n=1 Tax=Myodes glareolus TaxID=447135 RepID=A0AAW0I186_MYOGA
MSRGMPVETHWRTGTTITLPGSTDDSRFLRGNQIPSWANRLEEKTLLVRLNARLGCHLNGYLLYPSPVPGTGCERLRLRKEEEVIVTRVTVARSESCMIENKCPTVAVSMAVKMMLSVLANHFSPGEEGAARFSFPDLIKDKACEEWEVKAKSGRPQAASAAELGTTKYKRQSDTELDGKSK